MALRLFSRRFCSGQKPMQVELVQRFGFRSLWSGYWTCASLGFVGTAAGNVITGLVNPDPPVSIYNSPQVFIFMTFWKSLQHGLLWMSIPFTIFRDPREFFVLGNTVNKLAEL